MLENNGYLDSFVGSERCSKNRTSDFVDEEDIEYKKTNSNFPQENKEKIGSINMSNEKTIKKKFNKKQKCFNKNELMCIINLLASTFGSGALCFSNILYQIGIINSFFIFLFVSFCCYFSLDLLRSFVVDSRLFSFAIITQTTLGKFWLKIYVICSFIYYMSGIINYSKILYLIMKSMLNFLNGGFLKILYFLITCFIEIILCIFTNKPTKLFILSIIVVICYIIIFFTVIIKSIVFMGKGGANDKFGVDNLFFIKNEHNDSSWFIFLMIMSKFIEFFYGYTYHSSYPTILSYLDNISEISTKKIHKFSFLIIFFVYFFISFFGYLINKEVPQILFISDLNENNFLICLFKSILAILFICLTAVRYVVIRDNYSSLIGKENLPKKIEIPITIFCLFLINIIVCFVEDGEKNNLISIMVQIFGGLFGVFICFVLPAINHFAINRLKTRAVIGFIICFIFVVIGIFTVINNIHEINRSRN